MNRLENNLNGPSMNEGPGERSDYVETASYGLEEDLDYGNEYANDGSPAYKPPLNEEGENEDF